MPNKLGLPNKEEDVGASPLYNSAKNNQVEICELLLSYGANISHRYRGKLPLDIAKEKKNTKIVEILQAATDKKRAEIIANVNKAKLEKGKEEKICKDLFDNVGDLEKFKMMEELQPDGFDINWSNEKGNDIVE